MPLLIYLAYATALLLPLKANSEILSTTSTDLFFEKCSKIGKSTLVLLDINDTILFTQDQILQSAHKQHKQFFIHKLIEKHGQEQAEELLSIMRLQAKRELLDPNIKTFFDYLSSKDTVVFGLTTAGGGSQGCVASLEDWKLELLNSLGIDFSIHSFAPPLKLNEKNPKHPKRYPIFKSGIIFTCGLEKGPILKKVLDNLNFNPTEIVFIDNKLKNLESVACFCKDKRIKFTGILYTKVQEELTYAFDFETVQKQLDILSESKNWINQAELIQDS